MQYELPPGVEVEVVRGSLRTCLPSLARTLRRRPPDVLVSHLTRANIVARLAHAAAGRPCPIVLVEHSSASREFGGSSAEHRVIRALMRCLHPGADRVVCVSDAAARDLERFVGLPDGSALTLLNPLVPDDLDARAAGDPGHPWLDGSGPVIVGVGRLAPEKNWPLLLRALALVREQRHDVRLVLLGTGADEQALRAEAGRLGLADVVALPGFAANPYAAMRAASVVALTSRYEGLPSVLVEALAVGTPVVATASGGGVAEAVGGGRFGRLVPPDDPRAVADALLAALDEGVPEEARSWARSRFGVAAAAGRYEELVRALRGG
jgi:glycosyltransferase involved in cell wall biosynthesis